MAIEFRILGPLEVRRDGAPLALGGTKQRGLLALLLLEANRIVPRDRLVDELWGDAPPGTVDAGIHTYVSRVRRMLVEDGARLDREGHGYVLRVEPELIDAERFQRLAANGREALAAGDCERASATLAEALALWRGPVLADLVHEGLEAVGAAALEDHRLAAFEDRIDADLALGHHADLVPELETLVEEHPYREQLRAQLMLALYRAGRQAEALGAYRDARRTLVEDLGIEPSPVLRDVERAILTQDPAIAAPDRQPRQGSARTGLRGRRRALLAALAVAATAAAVAGAVVASRGSDTRAAVRVPPNSLVAIDPRTNRVAATVALSARPATVAVGEGAIWVTSPEAQTVTRIDPASRRVVNTIGFGGDVQGIAVGYGAVWVAGGNDASVVRLDARTGERQTVIRLAPSGSGRGTFAIEAGPNGVWAESGTTLVRIDPARNSVEQRIPLGRTIVQVEGGDKSVWVPLVAAEVVRIAASTGAISSRIRAEDEIPIIGLGPGSLWMALWPHSVWRFDPETGSVVDTVRVGEDPSAVATGEDAVWVVNSKDDTVSRIDSSTNTVAATIRVGSVSLSDAPDAIAAGEGSVWLAVQGPKR